MVTSRWNTHGYTDVHWTSHLFLSLHRWYCRKRDMKSQSAERQLKRCWRVLTRQAQLVCSLSVRWSHALPSATIDFCLNDDETRIAAGLRLGCRLVQEHRCICGSAVGGNGHHGLSCRKSAGRQLRHRLANDVIARAFRSADVPAEMEPLSLLRFDGKRPDGVTLIPWSSGRMLVWDFTCPDTVAPSHIKNSSTTAGSAAAIAEINKRSKYSALDHRYGLTVVAVETMERGLLKQ